MSIHRPGVVCGCKRCCRKRRIAGHVQQPKETDVNIDKWKNEARRWAAHAYGYAGMVDEFPEHFDRLAEQGADPYEAVDYFAADNDLERVDQTATWGINSGKTFVREDYH